MDHDQTGKDGVPEIRMGPVPRPRAAISGDLPLEPGYVQMAFPPPGGELVQAVTDENGRIAGYYRIRVEKCKPTAAEDFWTDPDDWIPGEFKCELRIGDDFSTRNMVDLAVELMNRSPVQATRLSLVLADVVKVGPGPAVLN